MDGFRAAASGDWSDNASPSTSEDCGANLHRDKGYTKRFVLYPDWPKPTLSELYKQQKQFAVTLSLHNRMTEADIRELLMTKFGELREVSFEFELRNKNGGVYNCPCHMKCHLKHVKGHPRAEWNTRNIRRVAKSNRVIYIRKTDTGEPKHQSEDRPYPLSSDDYERKSSGVEMTQMFSKLDNCTRNTPDSAYSSLSAESSTTASAMSLPQSNSKDNQPLDPEQEATSSSMMTGTIQERTDMKEMMENIADITPEEGDIAGGYKFNLTLNVSLSALGVDKTDVLFTTFGGSDVNLVEPVGSVNVKGKVPPGSEPGRILVAFYFGTHCQLIGTIPFEYTRKEAGKKENNEIPLKSVLEKHITDAKTAEEALIVVGAILGRGDWKSKEETSANEKEQCENARTEALSLLRMIVETAVKINAMKFFNIIFSTPVARSVFKCFKDEQVRLEEVARENGNEDLACFLEEKHKMYQPDESDSDDEVDWKALSKLAAEYQRRNAKSIETGVVADATSSERSKGYYGDLETSSSDSSDLQSVIGDHLEEAAGEPETITNSNRENEVIKSYFDKQTVEAESRQQEEEPKLDDLIGEQNVLDVGSKVTRSDGNSSVDSRTRQHGAATAQNVQNEHLLPAVGWPSLSPNPSFVEGNHQSNSNLEDCAGEWTSVTPKKQTSVRHIPQEKEQQFSMPSGRKQRFQSTPQQEATSKYQISLSAAKQTEEPCQYHETRNENDVHQLLLERPRDPFLRTSHLSSLEGVPTSLNYFSDYCTSVPLSETKRDSAWTSKTNGGISLVSRTAFDYLKQAASQTELASSAIWNEACYGTENTSSPLSSFVQENEFQREGHASCDERTALLSIGLPSSRSTRIENASNAMQASRRNWSSLQSSSTGHGMPISADRFAQEEPLLRDAEGKATVFEGRRKEVTSESEKYLQQSQIEESSSNRARKAMEVERRGYKESSNVKRKYPNYHAKHGTTGSEPLNKNATAEAGLSSTSGLPNGVLVLCRHFLQDNKTRKSNSALPKPCVSCEKCSNVVYGAWNNSRREWQKMRPYPKLSPKAVFRMCWHFENGEKCQKSPCHFAHGDKELVVWTLQKRGVLRPPNEFLVNGPRSLRPDHKVFGEPQQRGTLTIHQLKKSSLRSPPAKRFKEDFKLCNWWKRNLWCRHGSSCTFAHGEDDLRTWMSYRLQTCQDDTTCRVNEKESPDTSTERNEPIPESKWVRELPGVKVSVDPEDSVILHDNKDCHTFQWTVSVTFKAHEVGQLSQIDLLHREHHCYRLMAVKVFLNSKEQSSDKLSKERWSYKLPELSGPGLAKVEVGVSFESRIFGTFTQSLTFLFGKTTYLMQGLNVDIGCQEILSEVSKVRQELKVGSSLWTQGSMEVVPSPKTSTAFQDDQLLKRYKLPDRLGNIVSAQVIEGNVTCQTYQRAMHQLLFAEELSMKSEISRYVLHEVQLHGQQGLFEDMAGMRFATNDELFGILRFQEGERFNPDDSAGRLLLRNVCSVWLKLSGDHDSRRVYEVPVEKIVCEKVVLKLPSVVSNKLQVTDGCDVSVDAQFQLNRQPLCEQHAAIDRLGPLQMMLLFPDQKAAQVKQEANLRWKWLLDPRLNKNQEEVIRSIAAPGHNAPPLAVFGPFGTGKTFTLNQAVRHLVTNKSHRILLCTHSNRAADIHVELLHEYLTNGQGIQASKPLRIYQPMRRLATASQTARTYALIDRKNKAFLLPTRKDVIDHRVVITTLATSELLLRLQLNHGFFTHILVDEATQALEPEALTPLALAGPNTKVVFTGDHMQMSPEVYSQYARDWGLQRSLPERLFDHYTKSTNPDSMSPNVVFLTENYRCHPDILQFPSDNFYGKELVARGSQLAHPRLGPLLFFSARGKERREADSSYMNAAEVHEVVKRVKELADDWPEEWGPKVLSDIAVLSAYRAQVQAIRASLREQDRTLKDVTVDTIHNVQGQEFRAVFISTVRTAHTCQRESGSSQRLHLEFLSDPKLLNTAVTRAKSLVAVVGDPVSLCTIGECRGNWWDFIKRCIKHQTLHGTSYDELQGERNALLAKISLNPKASPFVPKPTTGSKESPDAIQEVTTGGCSIKENKSVETGNEEKIPATGMDQFDPEHVNGEAQEDERETANLSQEEAQDCSSDTSDIFDGFHGEDLDDEVVFPRYLDTIIQALVKKCKETTLGIFRENLSHHQIEAVFP